MSDEQTRWQPVMIVVNQRLECKCGALAIFVTGKLATDGYNKLEEVDCWCQDCFSRAQKEQEA